VVLQFVVRLLIAEVNIVLQVDLQRPVVTRGDGLVYLLLGALDPTQAIDVTGFQVTSRCPVAFVRSSHHQQPSISVLLDLDLLHALLIDDVGLGFTAAALEIALSHAVPARLHPVPVVADGAADDEGGTDSREEQS
jgi:hypothetical protein